MNSSANDPRRFHRTRVGATPAARRRATPAGMTRSGPANPRVLSAATQARAAAAMMQLQHTPRRPWWTCHYCQAPWPCVAAKQALAQQMNASALAMYMAGQMAAAVWDMPGSLPGALWTRFLSWTRSAHALGRLA